MVRRSGSLKRRSAEYDEDDVRVRPGRRPAPVRGPGPSHAEAERRLRGGRRPRPLHLRRRRPDRSPPCGPGSSAGAGSWSATGSASSATSPASGRRWPGSCGSTNAPRCCGVPPTTTTPPPRAGTERVIVANADQLVIVSSLADPPPRTGFIDRCLVAAYDADIEPLLCLTKADLAGPDDAARLLRRAGPAARARAGRTGRWPSCVAALRDQISVLVGHSGVGKSTLVNRLVPAADRAVGVVSAIGKGRHTSTSAVRAAPARRGGWIVDTPGVRSFGIAHVDPDNVLHGFPELVDATANCPPNCDHMGTTGDCGLDALVAAGRRGRAPARVVPPAAGLPRCGSTGHRGPETRPPPHDPDRVREIPPADAGQVGRPGRRCASRRRRRGPAAPRRPGTGAARRSRGARPAAPRRPRAPGTARRARTSGPRAPARSAACPGRPGSTSAGRRR